MVPVHVQWYYTYLFLLSEWMARVSGRLHAFSRELSAIHGEDWLRRTVDRVRTESRSLWSACDYAPRGCQLPREGPSGVHPGISRPPQPALKIKSLLMPSDRPGTASVAFASVELFAPV